MWTFVAFRWLYLVTLSKYLYQLLFVQARLPECPSEGGFLPFRFPFASVRSRRHRACPVGLSLDPFSLQLILFLLPAVRLPESDPRLPPALGSTKYNSRTQTIFYFLQRSTPTVQIAARELRGT